VKFKFEVQQNVGKNTSAASDLNCFTAKRLCLKAQGCRFGYPGLQKLKNQCNRNAVACHWRNPFRVEKNAHLLPRVAATLGFGT
jgi:hypothetical protein